MTCLDTRDRFSELVDGRLDTEGRAAVEAHLAGCDACRTELERFRATVALVQTLGTVQAPAGFAERVLAASREVQPVRASRPRWIERLVFPLPVKLPLQAAALLMVGVGVAYLFTHTPELQQATRVEAPAPAPSAPPSVEPTPAPPREAPAPPTAASAPASAGDTSRTPPPTAPVPQRAAPPPSPPAAVQSQVETRPQPPGVGSMAPAETQVPRVLRDSAQARDSAGAKEDVRAERQSRVQEADDRAKRAVAKVAAAPDLAGTLTVASIPSADASLRELVARHRGEILTSTTDNAGTVVELRIPRASFASFTAGLEALGRWRVDRSVTTMPSDVRIAVRLTE